MSLDSEGLRKRLLGPAMNMSIRHGLHELSGTANVKGDAYQSGSVLREGNIANAGLMEARGGCWVARFAVLT
jgi:hypothetical protein